MPIKSQAQNRLMQATAAGANTGVPKPVAKEMIAATPKKAYATMPAKAPKQPNPRAVAAVSKTPAKAYGLLGTKPAKPAARTQPVQTQPVKRQVVMQRKPTAGGY